MLYPSLKVVLGLMAKRMEDVQIRSQYREKLAALGTLAAGLAHSAQQSSIRGKTHS